MYALLIVLQVSVLLHLVTSPALRTEVLTQSVLEVCPTPQSHSSLQIKRHLSLHYPAEQCYNV